MLFSLKENVRGHGQLQEALLKSTLSSGPGEPAAFLGAAVLPLHPTGWDVKTGLLLRWSHYELVHPVGFNQFAFGPELSLAFGKCMFQMHSGMCSHLIDERRLLGSKCHWETKS